MTEYLKPTPVIDCDHPRVIEFANTHIDESMSAKDKAIRLFYAVRDGIRYDPYLAYLTVDGLQASHTLTVRRGWCVAKAVLLTACCRAVDIPAKIGFADVRNHMSTQRMREHVKDGIFYWHGYTAINIDGRWIKITPAFDMALCERFRVKPLDFDGVGDALFHPYDVDGKRHMEYLRYRGEFADVPIEQIRETYLKEYGFVLSTPAADFDQDVAQETGGNQF